MLAMHPADDLGAEMFEHAFGVVAAGFRFDHRGLARRRQACQQHRRFELRRGHRRFVGDRDRVGRALQGQRQPAAFGRLQHARAHALQRIEHAPHRPLAQRGVAVEAGGHRPAGHRAEHQPAAGARIAEIERRRRAHEAADADAMDAPDTVVAALQPGAERAHHVGGVQHVLAFQQAGDRGLAHGERPQDEGAVRDRLVAGHAGAALQRAGAAGGQRRQFGGGHGGLSLKGRALLPRARAAASSRRLARKSRPHRRY